MCKQAGLVTVSLLPREVYSLKEKKKSANKILKRDLRKSWDQ
jgi:hypothetical protein